MAILFDGVKPIVEFCREGISVKLFFEFGSLVHESLKDISDLQLWWPVCSTEQDHLGHFDRGHYEEHIFTIILNLN